MANKTIVQLTSKPTLTTADLIPVGDASTAILYKRTLGDLISGLALTTGSGTANYLTKWNSASELGASGIYESGGSLGIGTTSLTGINLAVGKIISGGTTSYGILQTGQVQSGVNIASGYFNTLSTQATAFTLGTYRHFYANQGAIGSTSAVTNQIGFQVAANLIGASNNYAFLSDIPAGTGRWNLYMGGTANNYLAGSLGIGSTALTNVSLVASKNITGATTSIGIQQNGFVQSDVTSTAYGFFNALRTATATFTLGTYTHYYAVQSTIGAGTTITNQYGFRAESSLIGAVNNYGFYGALSSGTGRWNLYMQGTAANYLAGNLLIGSASGVTGGELLQVNGDVNINGLFKINGVEISSGGGGTGTITGTGTTTYIPKWTSSSALGDSPIAVDGSNNVTIGSTVYTHKFNVLVNTSAYQSFTTYTANNWLVIKAHDGAGAYKTQVYDAYNHFWYASNASKMFLSENGDLYLNQSTFSGTYKLDVNGAIRSTVDVIITSDKRVKDNIINVTDALNKVDAMQGVYYTRKDLTNKKQYIGFLAQDLEGTLPQVVNQDSLGNYGVSYGNITALHNEAIKELNKEIKHLKSIINGFTK